jgi:hypothetical protein
MQDLDLRSLATILADATLDAYYRRGITVEIQSTLRGTRLELAMIGQGECHETAVSIISDAIPTGRVAAYLRARLDLLAVRFSSARSCAVN